MCGRFTLFSSLRELQQFFGTPPPSFEIQPNYNVAPTQEIPVIIHHEDGKNLKKRHWGLVPFWAKEKAIGCKMINTRAETVASKSAFRTAIKQRRCLIPADGFYEWQGKSGSKQPYYFHLPSGEPFAFAGLYEVWEDKKAPPEAGPTSPARASPQRPATRSGISTTECRLSSNRRPMMNGLIRKTRNLAESRRF